MVSILDPVIRAGEAAQRQTSNRLMDAVRQQQLQQLQAQSPLRQQAAQLELQQAQARQAQQQRQLNRGETILAGRFAKIALDNFDDEQLRSGIVSGAAQILGIQGVDPSAITREQLQQFVVAGETLSPQVDGGKVGRFRSVTTDRGTFKLDTTTGEVTQISAPQEIDITGLPQEMQELLADQPEEVKQQAVKSFTSVAGQKAFQEQKKATEQSEQTKESILDNVNKLLSADSFKQIFGGLQGRTPDVSQRARDVNAFREQLVSLLTLEARQKLKGQGAITDRESDMLARSVSILADRSISDEAAEAELKRIQSVFDPTKTMADDAQGVKFLGFE